MCRTMSDGELFGEMRPSNKLRYWQVKVQELFDHDQICGCTYSE